MQADVIRLAARTLSPSTWAAIGAACKLNPSENSEGLRTILDLARLHGARPEPVAAYFGWLRPARIEMRNGALRIAGPGGDFVHLYQGLASRDGIVLVPLADFETVCALALCRAQRYDRDRRVQVVPWGCRP